MTERRVMNDDVLRTVLASPRLPTPPTIAIEIIGLAQRPDIAIDDIARTISHDPALAGKVLRTANSSFYARARSVGTVREAVLVLGFNTVRTVALGFTLVDHLRRTDEGFDHVAFWQRSVLTATAARALAPKAEIREGEEAFLAGLLQRIGVLAMNEALGEPYQELVKGCGGSYATLLGLEQERFGVDHAAVGGALAQAWSLPDHLVAALRHHPEPERAPAAVRPLVRCAALGGHVADLFLSGSPIPALKTYQTLGEAWLGLSIDDMRALLERIEAESAAMHRLFDLPEDGLPSASAILARANEALAQVSLEAAQASTRLSQENAALLSEASTDVLTGIANRRHFDEFLEEQFRIAARYGQPLSLILMDLDQFKRINDRYGHQTGDRVLVEVAAAVGRALRSADFPARYGGDELGAVLPRTDLTGALRTAERLRAAVAGLAIEVGAGYPSRSVSGSRRSTWRATRRQPR